MKSILILLWTSLSSSLVYGVDYCHWYTKVHEVKVISKLKTGSPFHLKYAVKIERQDLMIKSLRLSYDLWDEEVEIEPLYGKVLRTTLVHSQKIICEAFKFQEFPKGRVMSISVLLNIKSREISSLLKKQLKQNSTGFFNVSWSRLDKKQFDKSVLLHKEFE